MLMPTHSTAGSAEESRAKDQWKPLCVLPRGGNASRANSRGCRQPANLMTLPWFLASALCT
jgi:hypothetical protein